MEETLVPLQGGQTPVISYGLYSMIRSSSVGSNASACSDLILILRNIGAKSIDMSKVTVENFTLQDSTHQAIKLYLWSPPRTIGYGDPTVVHLVADHPGESPQPWTLRFKSKPDAHVPFDLSITWIESRNATSDVHTRKKP